MAAITDIWNYTEQLSEDGPDMISYYQAPVDAMKEALDILHSDNYKTKTGGWKEVARSDDGQDIIFSMKHPRGRMLALECSMPCSVEGLFHEMYHNASEGPKWFPEGVLEFRVVLTVGKQADVCLMRSPDGLGGIVKSREYVLGRCWRKFGSAYCASHRSVKCKEVPETKSHVRADSHLNMVYITPVDSETNMCRLKWLVQTDIKGMLPKSLVDMVSHGWLLHHARLLRARILSMTLPAS